MGKRFETVICPRCGSAHTVTRRSTSHVLHLLLSVITLGLWVPIWMLISAGNSISEPQKTCPACRRMRTNYRDQMWKRLAPAILTAAVLCLAVPGILSAAEDSQFPNIDVDKLCSNGVPQSAPDRMVIINACIDRNQSGYNHLKFVWPLVSKDTYSKCEAMSRRVNPWLGYSIWADCVDNYIAMEQLERDRTQQRTFRP